VLDAIARVLRLGPAERWYLYRLAEVPGVPLTNASEILPPDVVAILDALDPTPACAYNGKYDLLASNASYAALFPGLADASGIERNALWQTFARPDKHLAVTDVEICTDMVAMFKARYAERLDDSEWTELVEVLTGRSEWFAELWASHPVAYTSRPMMKTFACFGLGTVHVRASEFPISGTRDCRMVVYVPHSAEDVAMIDTLRERSTAAG
jgi:MmyB-like transcription regulator ligand binding domain